MRIASSDHVETRRCQGIVSKGLARSGRPWRAASAVPSKERHLARGRGGVMTARGAAQPLIRLRRCPANGVSERCSGPGTPQMVVAKGEEGSPWAIVAIHQMFSNREHASSNAVRMFPNHEHSRMKLLGRHRLLPLYGMDNPTDAWLRGWVAELAAANWKGDRDVLRQFPRLRPTQAANIFLFPVKSHPQQIEVAMIFPQSLALIVDLKRIN